MNKCILCKKRKEENSDYCTYHEIAYKNILIGYKKWKNSQEITWNDYLRVILELKQTGKWVKEVSIHQLK